MKIKRIERKEQLLPFQTLFKTASVMAVDTETTGLNPRKDRLRLIQLAVPGMPVLVIDCFSFLPGGQPLLKDIFSSKTVKVFHNAKFDLAFLAAWDLHPTPFFDTMLAAQLLRTSGGPARANLSALAAHYLNADLDKEAQTSDFSGKLTESQIAYAAADAEILLRLREPVKAEIAKNDLAKLMRIEIGCAKALSHMEYEGIHLDGGMWAELTRSTERQRDDALMLLHQYTGSPVRQTTLWGRDEVLEHNFDSNAFVLELLHKNGVPVAATSKYDLYPFRDDPLVAALTAYRHAAKSLAAFLYPLQAMLDPGTERIYPRYHQISAWSGRMSCDRPNIQQIPRDAAFRSCFTAPKGRKLVIADYSQIELRVAAEIAGDERMIDAYREGRDLHLLTASLIQQKPPEQVDKQARQAAKAVNFGLVFGMGAAGLQKYAEQTYGAAMTLQDAELFRKRFFASYPGIDRWHKALKKAPPETGRTLAGRKFVFPENAALPITTNTPVQGSAADITKKALSLLIRRLPAGARIVAVVHDEILMEVDAATADTAAAFLKQSMEEAGNSILSRVPCVAEAVVADSWAEK